MLVPAFMPFGDEKVFLAEGIGREVYERLKADAFPRWKTKCPRSIPVETLKIIYDDMIADAGIRPATRRICGRSSMRDVMLGADNSAPAVPNSS